MASRNALILSHNHFTIAANDVKTSHFTLQTFRHEIHGSATGAEFKGIKFKEGFQNLLGIHPQSLEQNGHRHLTTTVNSEIHQILRIKFKIEPRTTIRNHAGGKEQLSRAVRLTLVVFEEQTGRAVQLADDHTFGTVNDEGSFFRHERDFAHVNIIFTDFFDPALGRIIAIDDFQTNASAQTAAISQASQLAFGHIKNRLVERIALKNQTSQTVVAGDRENRRKCRLQTEIRVAISGSNIGLQKFGIRPKLHFQQGRHCENTRTSRKTLSNALLFSERVRHGHSVRREIDEKNDFSLSEKKKKDAKSRHEYLSIPERQIRKQIFGQSNFLLLTQKT